ncbi:MAG: CHAP domain-containing protein, partial [Oscillospiraceae bacterium]|nr:CHAP domain-containing protein [Oscillospiraceae bacterium]
EDAFPQDIAVDSWIEKLSASGQFESRSYTPKAGDLAFFDMDMNGKPDHVGIVFAVDAGAKVFATVEGNHTEEVRPFQYALDDEHIVGYGVLPKNPDSDPQPHYALSADTTTQQPVAATENPESTSAPAENNTTEAPALETSVSTVSEGNSDYGSFVTDSPVPEGTTLYVASAEPSKAVADLIRNYVAKPMQAEPDEITVLAYTVWLVTPQGEIAKTGANVSMKTMLPLPVLDNSAGTPVLAQVKDCAVVYSSEDGTLHFYNAEVQIENGVITGISFRAPEAALYALCFVLK